MNPSVSVIMGVYNGGRFLSSAIESILGQTFRDLELLVIDDASTDDTAEFLSKIDDPRLIVLTNTANLGLTRSLNKGISAARGTYIARHDADDESTLDRLMRQYQFMESQPEIGLLGTHTSFINGGGETIGQWRMPTTDQAIRAKLEHSNAFCHGSVFMRRSVLDQAGVYREKFRYTQDYELWLRIAEVTRLANLPEPLYRMRRGSGTVSRQRLHQQLELQLLAWELAKERRKKGSDRYEVLEIYPPDRCLRDHFAVPKSVVTQLKRKVFLDYFHEATRYKDYLGALRLRWTAFRMAPSISELHACMRDSIHAVSSFFALPRAK